MKLFAPVALGSGKNFNRASEIGSVTWARCAAVGTSVKLGDGFTWRNSSKDAKTNVLFFLIGPPPVAPNWLRCSGVLVPPDLLIKKSVASKSELRRYSNTDPWIILVPLLVTMLTCP